MSVAYFIPADTRVAGEIWWNGAQDRQLKEDVYATVAEISLMLLGGHPLAEPSFKSWDGNYRAHRAAYGCGESSVGHVQWWHMVPTEIIRVEQE